MKSKLPFLLLGIFLFSLGSVKSQVVPIPDPSFLGYLQSRYPACVTLVGISTACADTISSLDMFNLGITDLSGIEHFYHLKNLICARNDLSYIPPLPVSLVSLDCSYNKLSRLPFLSDSLTNLDCYYNRIDTIFAFPLGLKKISCDSNYLHYLPDLPDSLTDLSCSLNQINKLPNLPPTLKRLNCGYNPILCLPFLPQFLSTLNIMGTYITCLPNSLPLIGTVFPLCDVTGNAQCRLLNGNSKSESFPPTGIRKIIQETLYMPLTNPNIDTVACEITVFNKTPTQKDTLIIFGNDIVLGTPTQVASLYNNNHNWLWQGKIPYDTLLHSSLGNSPLSDSIKKAIRYFNVRAASLGVKIAFVPKETSDVDYVEFVHVANSFASHIGRVGGRQSIWVDKKGATGSILHEMTHALGMYHEHQRDSAQYYLKIELDAIRPEFKANFCRVKDIQQTPYDYNSVMHYSCHAFSMFPPIDGINIDSTYFTIKPKGNAFGLYDLLGQRADYTHWDIVDINQLYPEGIIAQPQNANLNPVSFELILNTATLANVQSVTWNIYDTEKVGTQGLGLFPSNGNMYQVSVSVPQPITLSRPIGGFVVATVNFINNIPPKKYYRYVYRK